LIGWCVFWCAASRRRRTRLPGMPASANRAHMLLLRTPCTGPSACHARICRLALCIEAFCHIAHIWHCRRASLRWACRRQSTAAALLARLPPAMLTYSARRRGAMSFCLMGAHMHCSPCAHAGPSACYAPYAGSSALLPTTFLPAIVLTNTAPSAAPCSMPSACHAHV
jgi:hypothetical protein